MLVNKAFIGLAYCKGNSNKGHVWCNGAIAGMVNGGCLATYIAQSKGTPYGQVIGISTWLNNSHLPTAQLILHTATHVIMLYCPHIGQGVNVVPNGPAFSVPNYTHPKNPAAGLAL